MIDDNTRVFLPVDEPFSSVSLAIVKRQLAKQGLYVIDAADQAVLDAMGAVDEMDLQMAVDFAEKDSDGDPLLPAMRAEFARREAKG